MGVAAVPGGTVVEDESAALARSRRWLAEANDRPNDTYAYAFGWVPCTDGDLYYQCAASGADTLDAILRVWGYV